MPLPCRGTARVAAILLAICPRDDAVGDVRLPSVFSSNMVVQCDRPLPVWGSADPGEEVAVTLAGHAAKAVADASGQWRVTLAALKPGGPHAISVQGKNAVSMGNVLVGEVWLCSGQSNMQFPVASADNGPAEAAAAQFESIRLFTVPCRASPQPLGDVRGAWQVCQSNTVAGFSAVGFFFGRELHRELNVPIGLINSSWGGTRIEPWTPPEGFAAVPALADFLQKVPDPKVAYLYAASNFLAQVKAQVDGILRPPRKADDQLLDTLSEGNDGKRGDAPAAGGSGLLGMGLPEPEHPLRKQAMEIEKWLPLAAAAAARGDELPPLPGGWPQRGWPVPPVHPGQSPGVPTSLYNGMVHPLVPYALRGAIWYQGEANVGEGRLYREKMLALIRGWRAVWQREDLAFYYAQIAPYRYGGDAWNLPEIWEAQTMALTEPHTGMAVTTDIGNVRDIHPRNKQEVGRRLALWALAETYGRSGLVHSGPLYKTMAAEGGRVRVRFDHVGGGLKTRDGAAPTRFEIAGSDRVLKPATAMIDGETVVVGSEEVAAPVAVRFGWHQEAEPNLVNAEGLPASPFRTDDWTNRPPPVGEPSVSPRPPTPTR